MIGLGFRPATREERQLALLWSAAAFSVVVLRPLWIAVAPWLRPCMFRGLTGFPCPTCGSTRVALALLDADLPAAFAVNPLAAAAGLVFFTGGALALVWALARAPAPIFLHPLPRWWKLGLVIVILINWTFLIVTD